MANIKATPVLQDGDVNLKEGKVIEARMSKLLFEEAEIQKEIRDKYSARLTALRTEQDEIVDVVVQTCRKFNKDWTFTKLPGGIRFAWKLGGSVFKLDESKIAKVPKTLYSKHLNYRLITANIEAYIKANGKVPAGISASERDGSPSFTVSGEIKAKISDISGS